MASIFSCKLFRAHKNKDKVIAALTNSVNMELTEQVASLIDDKDLQFLIDKSNHMQSRAEDISEPDKSVSDTDTSEAPNISKESAPSISMKRPSPNTFIPKGFKDSHSEESEESQLSDGTDADTDTDASDVEDTPAEATEDIADGTDDADSASKSGSAIPVTAGASVQDPSKDISTIPSQIKSLLNMSADTSGVTRVSIRDNELWIYYNDKTNLNNVMSLAIDALMAASYYYLEFNRLARTDNAMVFQIEFYSTNEVNTVKDAE